MFSSALDKVVSWIVGPQPITLAQYCEAIHSSTVFNLEDYFGSANYELEQKMTGKQPLLWIKGFLNGIETEVTLDSVQMEHAFQLYWLIDILDKCGIIF